MDRRAQDEAAIAAAKQLADRIKQAVQQDYPDLRGYMIRLDAIVRTGPGPDDWRWDASKRGRGKRARVFLREAVAAAASRISEAHGLGSGSEWARRHFGKPGDERAAVASHVGADRADSVARSVGLDCGPDS